MTKYKCGCETDGFIIMTSNICDYITYREWADSVGVLGTKEVCLYCYLEKQNIKFGGHCGYIKGKWKEKQQNDKHEHRNKTKKNC